MMINCMKVVKYFFKLKITNPIIDNYRLCVICKGRINNKMFCLAMKAGLINICCVCRFNYSVLVVDVICKQIMQPLLRCIA